MHKWGEALTVGISFAKSNIKKQRTIILISIFVLATPLGAVTGILFDDSSDKVKAILSAISAGTFVYISTVEIICEEFSGRGTKFGKFIMFLLGVGFMVLIWFLEMWFGGD